MRETRFTATNASCNQKDNRYNKIQTSVLKYYSSLLNNRPMTDADVDDYPDMLSACVGKIIELQQKGDAILTSTSVLV